MKQAISDLKRSLAKNPEDKEARIYLGDALFLSGYLAECAGQLEDALNCFEQAAAIHMACEPSDSDYSLSLQVSTRDCKVSPIDSDRVVERGRRNVRDA